MTITIELEEVKKINENKKIFIEFIDNYEYNTYLSKVENKKYYIASDSSIMLLGEIIDDEKSIRYEYYDELIYRRIIITKIKDNKHMLESHIYTNGTIIKEKNKIMEIKIHYNNI